MSDVRLIDANDVVTIQVFDEMTEEYFMQTMTIAEMIDRWADEGCPPTIDAVPVVHGRWIDNTKLIEGYPDYRFNCSECDFTVWRARLDRSRYCPNCGAKMDLKEDKPCE